MAGSDVKRTSRIATSSGANGPVSGRPLKAQNPPIQDIPLQWSWSETLRNRLPALALASISSAIQRARKASPRRVLSEHPREGLRERRGVGIALRGFEAQPSERLCETDRAGDAVKHRDAGLFSRSRARSVMPAQPSRIASAFSSASARKISYSIARRAADPSSSLPGVLT